MSKVSFRPLGDGILIKQLTAKDKTPGGLLLPDTAKEKPQSGRVVVVGPGKYDSESKTRLPMSVKVDDVIVYRTYAATDLKIDNEDFVYLNEVDVMGVA